MANVNLRTFYSQLLTKIGTVTAVTDLISTRYYNTRLPQNVTWPALMFQLVSDNRIETKSGSGDYDIVTVQFNCYAGNLDDCEKMLNGIDNAMNRYRDEVSGVKIHQTFFNGRRAADFDDTAKIYWGSIDFNFHLKT